MKYRHKIGIFLLSINLVSCEILWLFDKEMTSNPMGAGAPEVNSDGKFADSDYNRAYFEKTTRRRIENEKNNPKMKDFKEGWKASFDVINSSSENPKWEKDLVIRLRREAGLPIWSFMLE